MAAGEILSVSGLQDAQADIDDLFWSHPAGEATVEHATLHLTGLVGELAEFVQLRLLGQNPDPSFLTDKLIPELAMHASRLANMSVIGQRFDLVELVDARQEELIIRFGSRPPAESRLGAPEATS